MDLTSGRVLHFNLQLAMHHTHKHRRAARSSIWATSPTTTIRSNRRIKSNAKTKQRDRHSAKAKEHGCKYNEDKYVLFGLTDARKPADVLIHVYHNGETRAFDVVVKAPFAKRTLEWMQ